MFYKSHLRLSLHLILSDGPTRVYNTCTGQWAIISDKGIRFCTTKGRSEVGGTDDNVTLQNVFPLLKLSQANSGEIAMYQQLIVLPFWQRQLIVSICGVFPPQAKSRLPWMPCNKARRSPDDSVRWWKCCACKSPYRSLAERLV